MVVLILAVAGGLLTAWWWPTRSRCRVRWPSHHRRRARRSSSPVQRPRPAARHPRRARDRIARRRRCRRPRSLQHRYVYVVQPGDHLINIADLYGVDVEDIIELNDIKNANRLFVGQELLIPGYGTPAAREDQATPQLGASRQG